MIGVPKYMSGPRLGSAFAFLVAPRCALVAPSALFLFRKHSVHMASVPSSGLIQFLAQPLESRWYLIMSYCDWLRLFNLTGLE
jgi:hypothetical protein